MKKQLKVDVSSQLSKLHNEWDGMENGSFTKHITKNKNDIINTIKDTMEQLELFAAPSYKFNQKEKEVILTFEWKEKENINEWLNNIKVSMNSIVNYYWSKGINAYV